ncbi:Aste57867_16819 [Aphanomyces stellatus]|uniref:Aste57867_16819 protein n=1 Tax=Aphanomyces stellatus TaxID=120398 RepID=A0A485L9F6_9STRA|nr:hypothetical protein As57867_016761 [Aphanomyces stellatus]VFT93584.1 Aste57867_16819 [Aphanomyces stellatus]
MTIIELLDGGTGEELFRLGVPDDRKTWSAYALTHSEFHHTVVEVHRSYIQAGAAFITCNNYMVTPAGHFSRDEIAVHCKTAGELAVEAVRGTDHVSTKAAKPRICGSLPPLSESYRFDLVLPEDQAMPLYTLIGEALSPYVDVFLAETMSSIAEARMAVRSVVHLAKPIMVSFTLGHDGALRSGEAAVDALRMLEQFQDRGVNAILFNCCEPESITAALRTLPPTSLRLGAYANALTPVPEGWVMDGNAAQPFRADLSPPEYLKHVNNWISLGVTLVGGCCAVGPGHIDAIRSHVGH